MKTEYLVCIQWEGEEEQENKIMTAAQIFNMMDMSDCWPIDYTMDIWRIDGVGFQLAECGFRGKWHDPSDPLKMVINCNGTQEVGYGTDH